MGNQGFFKGAVLIAIVMLLLGSVSLYNRYYSKPKCNTIGTVMEEIPVNVDIIDVVSERDDAIEYQKLYAEWWDLPTEIIYDIYDNDPALKLSNYTEQYLIRTIVTTYNVDPEFWINRYTAKFVTVTDNKFIQNKVREVETKVKLKEPVIEETVPIPVVPKVEIPVE